MESTLYLHVGHGKTGSSFIQSTLALNKDFLSENNINYPIDKEERLRHSKGNTSSGNWDLLTRNNYIEELEKLGVTENESLLFSGEALIRYIASNKNNINSVIFNIKNHFKIQQINILLLIRDPGDHLVSKYHQRIKGAGFFIEFDEYSELYAKTKTPYTVVLQLLKTIKTWENANITILNYSRIKYTLINEVSAWLNISSNMAPFKDFLVNRSLGESELELQKTINKSLNELKFDDINYQPANKLIHNAPGIKKCIPFLSTKNQESFEKKMDPILTELNYIIPKEHRYKKKISLQTKDSNDELSFTKKQIEVIGKSFAEIVYNLNHTNKECAHLKHKIHEHDMLIKNDPMYTLHKLKNAYHFVKNIPKLFIKNILRKLIYK